MLFRSLYGLIDYLVARGKNLATSVEDDLHQYIALLRASGLKESTIARKVVAIRSLYAFLSKESGQKNIALEIDVPKIPKRLPKALSITEITSLIESAGLDGVGIRDRALLELLYSSGARISEVIGLNAGDISSSEEGFATLQVRGKAGKDRIIPIGSFARKALDDYLVRIRPTLAAKKASNALFLNLRGGRLSRQAAWNIVLTAAKKAGLERKIGRAHV